MTTVTDTSVVLNLAWLRQDRLLGQLFESVLAPPAVVTEFERLAHTDPRFLGLTFPRSIIVAEPSRIPALVAATDGLGDGEAAALGLSVERNIPGILIDERIGRSLALALGLQPLGLLGILVQAKKRHLLSEVLPLLDRVRDGARFRVANDLRERIAELAGENS